jgi:Domain of unknown function (DUF1735)
MKKILNNLAVLLSFTVIVSSCTKGFDDNFDYSYEEKTVMIDHGALKDANGMQFSGIEFTPPSSGIGELDLGSISLSTAKTTETIITIKLVTNNTLISNYNTTNFTAYEPMPLNALNLTQTYTIPAGQKRVPIKAVFNTNLADLSKQYALGLSIASVEGADGYQINPVYKDCLYGLVVKNKYDGLWKIKTGSTLNDVANAALTQKPDALIALVTAGPSAVIMYNMETIQPAWFNQPFHPILSGTAFSVYGGWAPIFNFNSSDAITSVTNYYGNPNPANTRGAVIDPSGLNNFTVSGTAKTIKVKYIMTQPSSVPAPPNHRVFFDETLEYTGPR